MREIVRTEFGLRLFKARSEHAKISQRALADAVGSTQSNIAELEKTGQGSSFTPQLAEACRVRVHWLSTGEGDMVETAGYDAPAVSAYHRVAEPRPIYGLADALQKVASAIEETDSATRADATEMIALLFRNPGKNSGLIPLIVEKLSGGSEGAQAIRSTR